MFVEIVEFMIHVFDDIFIDDTLVDLKNFFFEYVNPLFSINFRSVRADGRRDYIV